jgi:hypothetical protein
VTNDEEEMRDTMLTEEHGEAFELTALEQLIDKVNGEGRYQFCSFVIFSSMWFLCSWLLVGQSFFFDSEYKCPNI